MTSSVQAEVVRVPLDRPFDDQKPGTSGLRKSSRQFQTPHYLESFIEAVLQVLPVKGGTLVVGGDGRFGNLHAISVIARMAAAHGVAGSSPPPPASSPPPPRPTSSAPGEPSEGSSFPPATTPADRRVISGSR
jgi:hypothetical protein